MRPLTQGSLRAHLFRLTHGEALRDPAKPVVLTRDVLRGAFPRGAEQHPSLPAAYDAETYVLTGDDDLQAVK